MMTERKALESMMQPYSVVLGGFLLCACASTEVDFQPDQATALAVQKRVVALKAEIRKKVDAEERYYRDTVDALVKVRERAVYTETRREAIERAMSTAKALRDNPDGFSVAQLSEQIVSRAKATTQLLVAGVHQQKKYRESIEQSVQALGNLSDQYAALERTLVQMSQPAEMDIGDVARFIKDTYEHYGRLKKEEGATEDETSPAADKPSREEKPGEPNGGTD